METKGSISGEWLLEHELIGSEVQRAGIGELLVRLLPCAPAMPLLPLALLLVPGSTASVADFLTPSEKSWVNGMCDSLPGPGPLYRRAWK